MNENFQIRKKGEAVLRKILEVPYLVPISGDLAATGYTVELNEVGAEIWGKIKENETISFESLLEYVLETFEVSPEKAKEDLNSFLNEMNEAKLIEKETL